jgi:hypothetical protein
MNDNIANEGRSEQKQSVLDKLKADSTNLRGRNAAELIDPTDICVVTDNMKVSAATANGDSESVGDVASCNGTDEQSSPVTDPEELALLEKLVHANR